jgi:hypothetical protein
VVPWIAYDKHQGYLFCYTYHFSIRFMFPFALLEFISNCLRENEAFNKQQTDFGSPRVVRIAIIVFLDDCLLFIYWLKLDMVLNCCI